MEATGTYGEALRQALTDAGLVVQRVRSQTTSDYAEIFDGVPSQHDGKDAAMLAELGAIGKSVAWPSKAVSEETARLKAQVQWLTAQQEIWQTWQGRVEGLLAKFWPEATGLLSLQSATLLRVLREYGGPQHRDQGRTLSDRPTVPGKADSPTTAPSRETGPEHTVDWPPLNGF